MQELAGDDANIIFGAMFDENAQDEATITVIATGLDAHGVNTPVSKAMTEFTTPFKAKPVALLCSLRERAGKRPQHPQPTYKAPTLQGTFRTVPQPQRLLLSRPRRYSHTVRCREKPRINIPDFLKNKK